MRDLWESRYSWGYSVSVSKVEKGGKKLPDVSMAHPGVLVRGAYTGGGEGQGGGKQEIGLSLVSGAGLLKGSELKGRECGVSRTTAESVSISLRPLGPMAYSLWPHLPAVRTHPHSPACPQSHISGERQKEEGEGGCSHLSRVGWMWAHLISLIHLPTRKERKAVKS